MNKMYQEAVSSPESMVTFLVYTQYDEVLKRAISAKIANSDVGREALLAEVNKVVSIGDASTFAYLFSFPLQTSASNSAEANEAVQMLQARLGRQALETNGNSGSGWSSDNTSDAINTFGQVFGAILNWLSPPDSPAPTSGPPSTGPGTEDKPTDYTPWLIGGGVLLVVIVVIAMVLRKK